MGASCCKPKREEKISTTQKLSIPLRNINRSVATEYGFALKLLKMIPSKESGCLSPLSLALGLGLLEPAANGNTQQKLIDAVLRGSDHSHFLAHHSQVKNEFADDDGKFVIMKLVNHIFARNHLMIKPDYEKIVKDNFAAETEKLDFSAPAACVKKLTKLVREQTGGKLATKVTEQSFSKDTAVVLLSTLYFEAGWYSQFDVQKTNPMDFHCHDGTTRKEILVPKMNVKSSYQITDLLKHLDLKELTNPLCTNLSNFADEPIHINAGCHQAITEVTESGTIAAATTEMSMMVAGTDPIQYTVFRADRPFIFLLTKNGHPIIIGRYN